MTTATVILAAGYGKRIHSAHSKGLLRLAGKPLIRYALEFAAAVTPEPPVVVIGHGSDEMQQEIGSAARFVRQEELLGTAHALQCARPALEGKADHILVIPQDMPLFHRETLANLCAAQQNSSAALTMLTVHWEDSHGFGRIIRSEDGNVLRVVEEAHASPEELKVHEFNVGVYCFRGDWLWKALDRIQVSPRGEYYLTDSIEIARRDGLDVHAISVSDPDEALGINTRVHLAEAEAVLRQRINTAWMLAGVSMSDPTTVYIGPDVQIGEDTLILPHTHLRGKTVIGIGCEIGPNTIIEDTTIGNECTVLCSVLEGAILEDHVEMGPFGHLRKGAHLGSHVHMGNFGEVKNSYLAEGVKMGHFSYLGDATVGANTNIGAGTITCNFDGSKKHKTVIGENVFIGSDTMLVAPLNIGEGARTGAGAVVTHDVPENTTVIGVPARTHKKTHGSG